MSTQADTFTLHGAPGSGATVVHAALALLGLPVRTVDVSPWESEAERKKLAPLNPMRQVPVLVLPSGEVMTESAAILIWLGDRYPQAGLCPAAADPMRGPYLRWMLFIASSIYALFWIRDEPSRLIPDPAAQPAMLERSAERIAQCWHEMDAQMPRGTPYLLGDRLSMLDLYVTVASRWTPRRRRFYQEAPRMTEVVRRVDTEPRLAEVWAARFPFTPGWEDR